jgi:hypothetical protein
LRAGERGGCGERKRADSHGEVGRLFPFKPPRVRPGAPITVLIPIPCATAWACLTRAPLLRVRSWRWSSWSWRRSDTRRWCCRLGRWTTRSSPWAVTLPSRPSPRTTRRSRSQWENAGCCRFEASDSVYSDAKGRNASRNVRGFRVGDRSSGRFATPADFPPHDCSPYSHVHVRRESLGFFHRPRTFLCRPVPNPALRCATDSSL